MANIVAISGKRFNHWEIFVTGRREEPDGRPADYTRSSSAVISTNSRSRILLAILGGPIATGLKGLGTKYCIWCGIGPTVSALGVAPDGLEDKAAEARRSRPEWPAGSGANTGIDCGSGPK